VEDTYSSLFMVLRCYRRGRVRRTGETSTGD
jgi:hypothetical protein